MSRRKQGRQARTFQKHWFSDHKWLSYCQSHNVFCFYCRSVNLRAGLTFSKRNNVSFITKGFSNWKKAKQKFREHELSQTHNEAVLKFVPRHKGSVVSLLNSSLQKDQKVKREMLLVQLHCVRFLMRQGLAVRGHNDQGNLYQLMQLIAMYIPNLQAWLKDRKYQSPKIVNEQIDLMAKEVLRGVLADIKKVGLYSIIVDETRNSSGKEQLVFCLRWVSSCYEVFEDFIGLVHVEATDATTLKRVIQDCLTRCALPLSSCRGQAYDGAANMAGHLNGIAALFKKEEPKAWFRISCVATGSQCKRTGKRKNRTWLYSCVCRAFTLTSGRDARYSEPGLRPYLFIVWHIPLTFAYKSVVSKPKLSEIHCL